VAAALPGYTVGDELGAGAFGIVLAAHDGTLDRPVAVKVLATSTPLAARSFRVEAHALGRLEHPHIVRTYDEVTHEDLCLLVMELVGGGTLASRRPRPTAQEACAVGLALADALALSHSRGVLHRDVKPANILFTDSGQPKLADFGIAKIIEASMGTASQIVGTPRYMAPEQILSGRLGPATDLFALATTLYELLSGTTTAPASAPMPVLMHYQLEVAPPAPPGVPEPLTRVIMRGLAKRSEDRYRDAHTFATDVARAATDVFGRDWLRDTAVPVQISDDLRALTTRRPQRRGRPARADGGTATRRSGRTTAVAAATVALAVTAGVALGGGASWAATPRRHAPAAAPAPAPAWQPGSLKPGYVATVAGDVRNVTRHSLGDGGPAAKATFLYPTGLAIDPARGYLYIADRNNERIRRIDSRGTITTVAGNGISGFRGDGGPATAAELNDPIDVAVGPDGGVYIADEGNHRIRRLDTQGVITTVAGTGDEAFGGDDKGGGLRFSGDGVPAVQASVDAPSSLVLDSRGDLYIADESHDRIRRVDTRGIITTVAGTGAHGFGGDGGPAAAARLATPKAVALGPDGSLYVADLANERIRRISPQGVITTIAGTGTKGNTGDGGPAVDAEVDLGEGHLAVDQTGTVYLTSDSRVRRIDVHGIITTVTGTAAPGNSFAPLTDVVPTSQAVLGQPAGLAIDAGILYIMDDQFVSVRAVRITAAPGAHNP
jgi:sugar lactone lactonase YvrE